MLKSASGEISERFLFYKRLIITTVIKLSTCFCFKFPNCSKMSLVLRVFRAPELENTRHNKTVNNANTGDYNVFYLIEIYQRKGCQTAEALFFMAAS